MEKPILRTLQKDYEDTVDLLAHLEREKVKHKSPIRLEELEREKTGYLNDLKKLEVLMSEENRDGNSSHLQVIAGAEQQSASLHAEKALNLMEENAASEYDQILSQVQYLGSLGEKSIIKNDHKDPNDITRAIRTPLQNKEVRHQIHHVSQMPNDYRVSATDVKYSLKFNDVPNETMRRVGNDASLSITKDDAHAIRGTEGEFSIFRTIAKWFK